MVLDVFFIMEKYDFQIDMLSLRFVFIPFLFLDIAFNVLGVLILSFYFVSWLSLPHSTRGIH
jgi:hypothetical protein